MRDSQAVGHVLLAVLLVVVIAFGRGSAQQHLFSAADSLTEGVGGAADISKNLQSTVVDSINPEVMDQLVKAINPVVTPNNTRLTFMPTARSLKSGTGYVESQSIFLWSVGYGVNDQHAVLGGMSLLPGVQLGDQIFYLGSKSSIYKAESAQLSAGFMSLNHKELDSPLSALYGVATFGGTEGAVSVFVAYGFEGTEMADQPLINLGGERRLGRKTYFVGEYPIYEGTPIWPFVGLRRYSEDGASYWGYTFPYFLYFTFGFGGD